MYEFCYWNRLKNSETRSSNCSAVSSFSAQDCSLLVIWDPTFTAIPTQELSIYISQEKARSAFYVDLDNPRSPPSRVCTSGDKAKYWKATSLRRSEKGRIKQRAAIVIAGCLIRVSQYHVIFPPDGIAILFVSERISNAPSLDMGVPLVSLFLRRAVNEKK